MKKRTGRGTTAKESPKSVSGLRRGAIGWLEHVAAESPHPDARRAATQDIAALDDFGVCCKRLGSKTRRSWPDALAGVSAKEGETTTTITCGKKKFIVHIWAEARERRGLPPLASATKAGVAMEKRVPQKGRWGRKLRT